MQPRFKYEPRTWDTRTNKTVKPASFSFVIKNNGIPVEPPIFNFDHPELQLSVVHQQAWASCHSTDEKLVILIPRQAGMITVQAQQRESALLMRSKGSIPSLIKALKDAYKPIPMVDIETGAPVVHKITAEYAFQDEVVTEQQVNRIATLGSVFFDCKLSSSKVMTGHCKAGVIVYPSSAASTAQEWHIKNLGLNYVPEVITWSAEEIEEAFRDLANNLLAEPDDPSIQVWKIKEVAQIALE